MMNESRALPTLDFQQAVKEAWSKVAQFSGRSRRSEFWWSYLAIYIGTIVISMIPLFGGVASVVLWLATIPLVFRRLHDTGRSGWWWGAECLVSMAGAITFIINMIRVFGNLITGGNHNIEPVELVAMIFKLLCDPLTIALFSASIILKIVILVFLCQDSTPEPNQYGESPKYVVEE